MTLYTDDEQVMEPETKSKPTVGVGILQRRLRWVMEQWLDATEDGEHIPAHLCWFTTKPDAGYCPFHEDWFSAAEECGLMDEWAEADAEAKP